MSNATLAKPAKPAATKTTKPPFKKKGGYAVASALAGKPISLMRTTSLDVVIEKPVRDPRTVLPFLTGYRKDSEANVLKALTGPIGTKVGWVLGGDQASKIQLNAREVGGDFTFRIRNPEVELGDTVEPDLRLTSIVMLGCERFTEDDAWLVLELAGYDETPEELAARINADAWKMVNVVEHVPLPVAAALRDLLMTQGFSNISIREAVPRI